jgi:hypothetical protein
MLKRGLFFLLLFQFVLVYGLFASDLNQYFNFEKSLRIDFVLTGTANTQTAGLVGLIEEPYWSGNTGQLIWPVDYGTYRFDVCDANGRLLFRNGFSTLFEEWQTTALTKNGPASFEQSISIPFPKQKVELKLFCRQKDGFEEIAFWTVDPNEQYIKKNTPVYKGQKIYGNGDPSQSLDLVFLAEGYILQDSVKAFNDAKRFSDYLFKQEPFSNYREKINIWLVHVPSLESGTSEPGEHIFKNTILGSSFNSLGLDRYLTITDYFKMKDLASATPYDFPLVMVNTKRYGGGGIFNHFSVFASDSDWAEEVFIHEFGHHFGGLADEYFNSEVSYEEMLDVSREPWNPNITTLVDFDGKWSNMVTKGTPVPTPRKAKYKDKTGVFEGGAYMSKGVYSPSMDCRMRSNTADGFCPACQTAIEQMLKVYIK